MTLIIFALLIGIALGAILKGMVKIGLVVALAVAAVVFTCRELNIDWHKMLDVAADQAAEQYHHVEPHPQHRTGGLL
jgi:hypothetical protein